MNFTIGEIVKAQGIRGEVKIKPYAADIESFVRLGTVAIGGCPMKIRGVNVRGGFVFMSLEGVNDRNSAEVLVGKTVEIDRALAKPTDKDEYYVVDLIGCTVFLSGGEELGVLDNIENFGSADIFTVKGKRTVRFPFLKRLNLRFDKDAKTVTIDKERFQEVCCYED